MQHCLILEWKMKPLDIFKLGSFILHHSGCNHESRLSTKWLRLIGELGLKPTMLPKPGIYYFPWEVSAGHVPDGETLRTFGRLCLYDVTQSRATLRAQKGSDQHQVLVCTKLVEPFQAQVGSLYVVLGELQHEEGAGSVVKARVLACVEGINLPLLERAIQEQRLYQQERGSSQQEVGTPADPTSS